MSASPNTKGGMAVVAFDHVVDAPDKVKATGRPTRMVKKTDNITRANGANAAQSDAPAQRAILISHTRERLSDRELDAMMLDNYRRNTITGITGLRLYKSRSFFEVLEGPPEILEPTLHKIFMDPSHYKMKVMLRQDARRRRFANWSMGFRRLDGSRTTQPCYFNLTRRELEARFPHGATKEILFFLKGYLAARFPQEETSPAHVKTKINKKLGYGTL